MLGHLLFILGFMVLGAAMPDAVWQSGTTEYLFVIGGIGLWRYSWGALHIVRALIYRKLVFPRWRAEVDALGDDALPDHAMLLVTSFRIGTETTRRVYKSVFDEAFSCGTRTTVIASIVEMGDQRLIKTLFDTYAPDDKVRLKFVRIAGTGKRDALAVGFRAIAAENPGENDIAAVIDGDSMLEPGLVRRSAGFFKTQPKVGALTTDEVCEVE
ncbi:MAG TPA: glycosyltransferase, partial [Paracoccaceae bacterium]|nr:glycosyltransferase [Paracoccaceae bacterium]